MRSLLAYVLISSLFVSMLPYGIKAGFAEDNGVWIVAVELDPPGNDYYSDEKEWIEIANYGREPVTLGAVQTSSGYTLSVSGSATLQVGQSIRLMANGGTLKNCEETLLLFDSNKQTVDWASNLCDGYDDARYLAGHHDSWKLTTDAERQSPQQPTPTPTPPTPTPTPKPPSTTSQGKFTIKTNYELAKSDELKDLSNQFIKERTLDTHAEVLSSVFDLPHDLNIVMTECGTANAAYVPSQSTVFLCYELVDNMLNAFKSTLKEGEVKEAALNAFTFAFYHEFGHALIDVYNLDVLGKEEDAADSFATLLLIWEKNSLSPFDAALWWKLTANEPDETAFADEHSLNQQRFYNILCLLYGSNPEEFPTLVKDGWLPETRANHCRLEYGQATKSWGNQLSSHLREQVREQVNVTAEIVFDKDEYTIKDNQAIISVVVPSANTMHYDKDAVDVFIWSTSDPVGITLKFSETGPDTGIFEKVVNLKTIKRSPGDTITAEYIPSNSYGIVFSKSVKILSDSSGKAVTPKSPSEQGVMDMDVKVTLKQLKDLVMIRVKGSGINSIVFTSEPVKPFIKACKSKGWQTITCTDQIAKFESKAKLDGKQVFILKVDGSVDSIAWTANAYEGDTLVKGKQGVAKVIR